MNVGISTASLFNKEFNEDALPIIDKMGAEVVEIFLESFCEYTVEFANLLKSRLGNLKVHSVHTINTNYEPQLFTSNPRSYNDAILTFESVIKSAAILGAKNNTFHGRIRIKTGRYDNYEDTGKYFNILIDKAKARGVNVCLENVEWAMYNHAGYFEKLKPFSPDLKACLDIKQARLSGYDYRDYLKEMADRLETVHISDYNENGKILLPGKGLFDFERLIGELNNVNFKGAIILEVYNNSYGSYDELAESLNYIKNLVKRG